MDFSKPLIDEEIKNEFIENLGLEKYEMYNKMYYEKLEKELSILKTQFENKEYALLKKTAHSLKGLSYNLGYSLIGDFLAEVEALSKLEKDFPFEKINTIYIVYENMKDKYQS